MLLHLASSEDIRYAAAATRCTGSARVAGNPLAIATAIGTAVMYVSYPRYSI